MYNENGFTNIHDLNRLILNQSTSHERCDIVNSLDSEVIENLKCQTNLMENEINNFDLKNIQYHGTTTIAFINQNSVILCIDSKASIGNYVGSRTVKKIFPVTNQIVCTMAGGAADCAYWIKRLSRIINTIQMKYNLGHNGSKDVTVECAARLLVASLLEFRGMGLSVGTIVAGVNKVTRTSPVVPSSE